MSVRTAELCMAVFLMLASLGLMYKATDGLNIGWVAGSGPGSGAWPFWLSAVMFLSCLAILARWFMGTTAESRSQDLFMDRYTVKVVGITVLALALLVFGTGTIGIYFSLIIFLFFYLKIMGGHTWLLSSSLSILVPIVVFAFFEYLMTSPLPKGISEPLFYPIYDLMY